MSAPRCACGRVQAAEGQSHRDRCFCDTYPREEHECPCWITDLIAWLRFAAEMLVALAVGLLVYEGIDALVGAVTR